MKLVEVMMQDFDLLETLINGVSLLLVRHELNTPY